MFSAYFLVKIWENKKKYLRIIVPVLFFFMIFGGIIDLFPIINDKKFELADYRLNKESSWIINNTDKKSVFLNTTLLYDPASIAGRKIFMGWPYFAWSQGYDTYGRGDMMKKILGSNNKTEACNLLKENKIDYIEIKIQNPPDPNVPPISLLYANEFIESYNNIYTGYSIYNVLKNCSN
jgi:hypothetical protein